MSNVLNLITKALHLITDSSSKAKEIAEAETMLKEAESKGCKDTEFLQLSLAYMELGSFEQSHKALEQAEKALPNNPAVELFSFLLAFDENNMANAQKALEKLKEVCPDNQALPTSLAMDLLSQNKVREALDILLPDNRHFDLTMSWIVLERLTVAVERILLPLELNDFSFDNISQSNIDTNEPLDTDSFKPNSNKNEESFETEKETQTNEALTNTDLQIAPELKDKSYSWLTNQGQNSLQSAWDLKGKERQQAITNAVKHLNAAYIVSPRSFQAAFNLGEALLVEADFVRDRSKPITEKELSKILRAQELFQISINNDGTNPYVLHYLARASFMRKKFTDAEKYWLETIDMFEKFPEAHYGLGQTYLCMGKMRLSRSFFTKSISSDPHLLKDRFEELSNIIKGQ